MLFNSLKFMGLKFGLLSVLFASPAIANENEEVLSVHFNPGAVMQLIAPVTEAEKRPLRDKYFELGAKTAREHGYTQNGVLVVEKTLMGRFSPNVFVVSQWSSLKAQKSFQALPLFNDVKSLRREAWEALKLFDYEVLKPTTLSFSTNKIYSVSLAWVNPKAPNDYYNFIDSFSEKAQALGGKVVSTTQDISLSDHNPYAVAPQQIVILEWNSANDIEAVLASSEYIAQLEKLKNGTVEFELHTVRPRI